MATTDDNFERNKRKLETKLLISHPPSENWAAPLAPFKNSQLHSSD
jgi:hypothetical protein